MAKIIAEFDTKEKTLSVSMDGKSVKDISSVYFMAGFDDPSQGYVEMTTVEINEEEKMSRITRLSASGEQTITTEKPFQKEIANLLKRQ